MGEEIEINMEEVLDVAARAIVEDAGLDWDKLEELVKFNIKENLVVPLDAALNEIIRQMQDNTFEEEPGIVMNPDCRDGKHQACSGQGWDISVEKLIVCPCVCHTLCHCGQPIYTELDGFTRGLCSLCSIERCDAPVEDYVYSCSVRNKKEN